MRARVLVLLWVYLGPTAAAAQVDGHVSLMFDVLPDVSVSSGAQPVSELRARLFVERKEEIGDHLRLNLSAHVDGLIRDWGGPGQSGPVGDAIARPLDFYADLVWSRGDLRVGSARLVWGRLDEFQPTDVVNPIDLSRFLLEGRSEARLPVALVRGRLFASASSTLEAVVVPLFRSARFDQLDEPTSPFDLRVSPGPPRQRDSPGLAWDNIQGGARFSSTLGRVDWGVSAYRGFRAFPTSTLEATPDADSGLPVARLLESFPRFTMLGADFETVRGTWGVRGEVAAFIEDELQSARAARGVPGRSIDTGVGIDRRAGEYRVAANVLWSWRGVDGTDPTGETFVGDPDLEGTDITLVVAADRSFGRETRTVRVFAAYDPVDATVFARVIGAISLRENLWLEGSGGVFGGSSPDILGRLTRRDFLYARVKAFF